MEDLKDHLIHLDFDGIHEIPRHHIGDADPSEFWSETETMWDRYRGMLGDDGYGYQNLNLISENLTEEEVPELSGWISSRTVIDNPRALVRHRSILVEQIIYYYALFTEAPPSLIEVADRCREIKKEDLSGE